jgi:transposase
MGSKSNVIRYLTYLGYSRSDIAKKLNVRYQMVKNIQDNDLKAKKLDISQIVKDIDAKMSDDKMEDTNQLSLEL